MGYDFKAIENKWRTDFYSKNVFKFKDDINKQKYYILDMFPYPSGAGLHVGHPKGYTFTDVISRYMKLKGYSVLHPMGFDAFGLPAEQYALQNNKHPKQFTEENIKKFRNQLQVLGFDYDYDLEVNTTDPNYFKWTQWTFIQMYKRGLAELEEIEVNWCEGLGTVLSNEEELTDDKGNPVSERGSFPVTKRKMWQWVLKITKYADRLIDQLDQLDWPESLKQIQRKWIGREVDAEGHKTYHLHDWIFSRQRYWGEPFPVYYDENGKQYLDENLPLMLPELNEFKPNKEYGSPLGNAKEWITFSKDGKTYRRDVNTMPQWAGSCWYYLGYIMKYLNPNYAPLDAPETKKEFDRLMNVDLYVGGQEHATLHLIYARFWFMFLHDIGIVSQDEPFQKLINQGMILAKDGRKMSKSWGNTIDPMKIVEDYGADSLRLYECFMGPITATLPWNDNDLIGVHKWLNRVYSILTDNVDVTRTIDDIEVVVALNKTIMNVEECIKEYKHNVAISHLMTLSNVFQKHQITAKTFSQFLIMLSCFAPFLSQELWSRLHGNDTYVHQQTWPTFDPELVQETTKNYPVQIDKKVRAVISVPVNASEAEIKKIALDNKDVKRFIGDRKIASIQIMRGQMVLIQLTSDETRE